VTARVKTKVRVKAPTAEIDLSKEGPTISIRKASQVLNTGLNQTYAAGHRGEIPVMWIGKRMLVLTEPLRRQLAGETMGKAG